MRTIAIVNQKGGCGKTTTAINLAGMFAAKGARTLLVDVDPQSHCAAGLAIPEKRIDLDIGDAMTWPADKPLDHARLVWRAGRNLDLIPSRMKLAGLEAGRGGLADVDQRERRLLRVLEGLRDTYEICVIDCSPSIGLLTYNAIIAADEIIIPVDTSFFSLQGAAKQLNTIRSVGRRLGVTPAHWVVATIHEPDSALAKDLLDELRSRFPKRVAPTVIRRDQSLKEAASFGQPISEYAPRSVGAADYASLADWLLQARPTTRRPAPDEAEDDPPVVNVTINRDSHRDHVPSTYGTSDDLPNDESPTYEPHSGDSPRERSSTATGVATPQSRTTDLARLAQQLNLARSLNLPRQRSAPAARPDPVAQQAPAAPIEPDSTGLIGVRPIVETRAPVFGARTEPGRAVFVQPLFLGRRVWIAGEFNDWKPDRHELHRDDDQGIFKLEVELEPGRHAYRLVIDSRWAADPFNSRFELNPFGEPNSVIDVPG